MTLPLVHIKVLDLTRVRAGPTAVRQLADWGADVIKIEQPGDGGGTLGGARHGPDFQNLHRNKRSLSLNLKSDQGREIFFKLVNDADVVVENYRPDVKFRLGIDYEKVKAANPQVVYASISGFGQDGPYGHLPGFDQVAQGMGGLMSITGLPGQGPVRAGIPVADLSAGLYTALGILTALIGRQHTGTGQWVQASLLEAQIAMLDFQAERWLLDGEVAPQAGNNHPTGIPTGVFATADGHINIAATGAAIYERFCEVMQRPDWLTDERFRSPGARSKNRDAMNAEIEAITVGRSSEAWIKAFNDAGVPAGYIYSIDEVFNDPQVKHLQMASPVHHPELGDINLVAQPVTLSDAPFRIRSATPKLGEHTDEVLSAIGYTDGEIEQFRLDEVV
ncbi:MAG: CoA transferase [Pseudomonadota bacterium]|uniref:Formyl-CoA transferase n=1 Tax=marine metagenome TaxID=408172 RepID=A0A381QQ46_9ZZZZ|nr:CoA transferase [Pseudomonadota bacterium]MEE3183279.1 CoA transferase [Pseudomonadota bacterium]HBP14742.1 formyl-CoA transferase [Gammaproteobacteria bacterium]HCP49589.1 formyl-CoA transferase [Gammaproteobacteria bacterium]